MDTSISFVDARAFANSINLLHFLLWFLCLLSLSPSLSSELAESDSELADPESDESELPDSSSDADSEPCFCYSRLRRGISFKYSRRFSVRPPRPMDVKKLMQNRVFFGLSFGNMDSKDSRIVGSFNRSFSSWIPRCSDNSCNIIN
ncbi:hypothetical protein GYH30_018976 [Glycine max]|nr:hypothetical protein JHK87_019136 [Glycine soja]KAH1087663.1 hypothetical protein GYH30_018976 [Glycine max]